MADREYAAFISYSHRDEQFAARLHRQIERWRTPRRLLKDRGRDGAVSPRLFPVFRDREELPTSSDLGGAIRSALQHSAYLIVLCSPRAAKSIWVDQEILEFKRVHGEGRIIAAILEGEPETCFPLSLKFRMGEDGELTDTPSEPIAADFRAGKDEWKLGFRKIIAGLLGVNLDDLIRRDVQRRRRRLAVGAMAVLIATLITVMGVQRWQTDLQAERLSSAARSGLASMRETGSISGIDRFARSVQALGERASRHDVGLSMRLLERLEPLDTAVEKIEDRHMVAWRGGTYLKLDDRLWSWPSATLYADLDRRIVAWSAEQGFSAYFPPEQVPLWTSGKDQESVETPCGLWADSEHTRLWVEGTRIGASAGSSYGYVGWMGLEDGAFSGFQRVAVEEVCGPRPLTSSMAIDLHRVDRSVAEFVWPRMRSESRFWQADDTIWPAPRVHLPRIGGQMLDEAQIGGAEQAEMLNLLAAGRVQLALECGSETLLFGTRIPGNSGGQWFRCSLAEEEGCSFQEYRGEISDWIVAPDCSTVAATGAGLEEDLGLLAIGRNGEILSVGEGVRGTSLDQGVFSEDGRILAIYADPDLIQIYRVGKESLDLVGQHVLDTGVRSLVLLDQSRLAALLLDGRLVVIRTENGEVIWSTNYWTDLFDERNQWWIEGREGPRGQLTSDESGRWLALSAIVPESRVFERYPGWIQRSLNRAAHASPASDRYFAFVALIDGRSGVPIGQPLSLINATGSEDHLNIWSAASLSLFENEEWLFSFPPFGAYRSLAPQAVDRPVGSLTGQGPDGPLSKLPLELDTR